MMFHLAYMWNTYFNGDDFDFVGIEFNTDGTKLFIYDMTGNDSIKQYSLNSPFNFSNAVLQKEYTGTSSKTLKQLNQPWDLHLALMALKCLLQEKENKVQELLI